MRGEAWSSLWPRCWCKPRERWAVKPMDSEAVGKAVEGLSLSETPFLSSSPKMRDFPAVSGPLFTNNAIH